MMEDKKEALIVSVVQRIKAWLCTVCRNGNLHGAPDSNPVGDQTTKSHLQRVWELLGCEAAMTRSSDEIVILSVMANPITM